MIHPSTQGLFGYLFVKLKFALNISSSVGADVETQECNIGRPSCSLLRRRSLSLFCSLLPVVLNIVVERFVHQKQIKK